MSRPKSIGRSDSLLHDLKIYFLHVDLLAEFRREFGALEELCVHACRHDGQEGCGLAAEAAVGDVDEGEKGLLWWGRQELDQKR